MAGKIDHNKSHAIDSSTDHTGSATEDNVLSADGNGLPKDSSKAASDIHAESHTIASHNDTSATGSELDTLTDGSNANGMHTHGCLAKLTKGGEDGIPIGAVVYYSGQSGNDPVIKLARANSATTMPAAGITIESGDTDDDIMIRTYGLLNSTNTVGTSVKDPIYVSPDTAGAWTTTKPIGTNLVQKIATVTEVGASGNIEVSGANRVNDIPNIPTNNIWLGDGDGVPQEANFDTEVSLNSDVVTNSAHSAGDGTDHLGVATKELDNLGTTAINADLLPSADNLRDLGTSANKFKEVFTVDMTFEDANADDFTAMDLAAHQLDAFNEMATTEFDTTAATAGGVRTITLTQPEGEKHEFIISEKRLEQPTQTTMTKVHTGLEGTDADPNAIYTYVQNDGADEPELTASNINPNGAVNHVDGVYEMVGSIAGSAANVYATNNVKAYIHEKIENILDRLKEQGSLYSSGIDITADADTFTTTSGTSTHVLAAAAIPSLEIDRITPADNQFTIEDDSTYTTYTDFQIDEYYDGVSVLNTHHVKCRIGVVINNPELTSARFHIIPQRGAATYITASQGWADLSNMAQTTPRDNIVKHSFIPIADILIKNTTGTFTLIANPDTGLFYSDVRGVAGGGGGGGGSASQNLYESFTGDSGSSTASSSTDSMAVVGGVGLTTAVTNDQVSIALDSPVAVANGGTNSSTALNNDFVVISNSGAIVESATVTVTELGLLNGETTLDMIRDTTPQLGAELDTNEFGISFASSLSATTKYEGSVTPWTISGLTFGQCVYMTTTNHTVALADADAEATMPCVGIYVGTNKVLTFGHVRQDTWAWATSGLRVYVGVDGNPTLTAPSGSGDIVQIIGITTSADSIFINPSLTEVKVA